MELNLVRYFCGVDTTLGLFFVDGKFFSYVLEPAVAPPGATDTKHHAICEGRFEVKILYSPKHQCELPHIINVPGRDAIEMHWGTTARDTDGCVIHGLQVSINLESVFYSHEAIYKLLAVLHDKSDVWVTVQNKSTLLTPIPPARVIPISGAGTQQGA